MPLLDILRDGWINVMDEYYATITKAEDIIKIRNFCSSKSLILVGARKVNSENEEIALCAVDSALHVLEFTDSRYLARKSLVHSNNSLFWYFVKDYSFGFSPNKNIYLDFHDSFEPQCDKRLSWYLEN